MEITFRPYRDSDQDDLKEMIHALYREDPDIQPMTDTKIASTIAEYKAHPGKLSLFLFEAENESVGYAILVRYWSNEYGGDIQYIDEVYVKPAFRSRGIGASFFTFIETMDHVAFQLETSPANHRAIKFYERLGFAPSRYVHLLK